MPRSRFIKDTGLTARMTLVMFLLGALFVGFVAVLMAVVGQTFGGVAPLLVAVIAIGIAFYQWWRSDEMAMKAMRAREVSPAEAPELHAMVDRLCAMADMPKPRVGIAEMSVPNAFATGRSPDRSVVCVTTGLLGMLTAEELEGVLAHELAHVAHRDVLVMTFAASAGILAGMVTQGARFGSLARGRNGNAAAVIAVTLLVSVVVYAVSFVLIRLLSRYRELSADRAGAHLTLKPAALGSALRKISGQVAAIPTEDLRGTKAMNAFFIVPALKGLSLSTVTATHPPLERRLEQLARIQTELDRTIG
ncbi:zinc metalloprotease HtpX [Nocardioides sp. Y6]|uniref:Protease HtpX homolog n=1 Tax=Nocardioides malaquae TaxID=2773426 RepID=A0ABR9RP19_9ACTN|nr:zinc metalloprotease HtpX [Nocardioides malaquae]MBE7323314.1 zinc metalloprotease HtpX [Nocardioides malaquae]